MIAVARKAPACSKAFKAPGWLALLAALTALGGPFASAAWADEPRSLREALMGMRAKDGRAKSEAPPVARYVVEGGAAFVLDQSGPRPLMRFETSAEVWALQAYPAPRGDVIYKNDMGQPVLRASRVGGLTLFTHDQPSGAPAALAGAAERFRQARISALTLLQHLTRMSLKASRAAGRLIVVQAPDVNEGSEYVVADAAAIAADFIARLSASANTRVAVSRVNQILLLEGDRPDVTVQSGVLRITVDPRAGVAGRPSSGRVARALAQR